MEYVSFQLQEHLAHDTIERLGELGAVQVINSLFKWDFSGVDSGAHPSVHLSRCGAVVVSNPYFSLRTSTATSRRSRGTIRLSFANARRWRRSSSFLRRRWCAFAVLLPLLLVLRLVSPECTLLVCVCVALLRCCYRAAVASRPKSTPPRRSQSGWSIRRKRWPVILEGR